MLFALKNFITLFLCSPRYQSAQLTRVADIPPRRPLRSSVTNALLVRPTQLVTVGDRAFPVAAANYGTNFLVSSLLPCL